MTLHITVVPASTNAGKETIRKLLADASHPTVKGMYRNTAKAPANFTSNPRFQAVQADVSSGSGVDFSGSDAVFYIPPPTFDGEDSGEFATRAARNVKAALEKAQSVRRLLLFSAIGAENERGIGIMKINHISDKILVNAVPEVVRIHPGWFMEFWAERLQTLKADPPYIESFISPADHKSTMVAVQDIAEACAQQLLTTGKDLDANPYDFTMHGPREYSANDVKEALEVILKKDVQLKVIERKDLGEYFASHVPQPYAREMAEMAAAGLPGGVVDQAMRREEGALRGRIELVDGLRGIVEGRIA